MARFRHFFVTTLIGGAVVLLPLVIFIFLIRLVVQFVDGILQPLSRIIGPNSDLPEIILDIIALTVVIAFCFAVGLLIRTRMGRSLMRYIEVEWLDKLPAYRTIRDIVQQFTGAKQTPFKTVVTVDVFNTGTRMTGFITDQPEKGLYTVFVPTAPNPTNGFIFHVSKEQLEFLDAKTEDAMRVVIGMGVGSNKILDKASIQSIKDSAAQTQTDADHVKQDN
jgi:uncharacterized membrane protein